MKTVTTTSSESRRPARRPKITPGRVAMVAGVAVAALLATRAGSPSEAQKTETALLDEIKTGKGTHQFDHAVLVAEAGVKVHAQPSFDRGGEDGNSQNVDSTLQKRSYLYEPLVFKDKEGHVWYGFQDDDAKKEGASLEEQTKWVSGAAQEQTTASGEPFVSVSTGPSHEDSVDTVVHFDETQGLVNQAGQRIAEIGEVNG